MGTVPPYSFHFYRVFLSSLFKTSSVFNFETLSKNSGKPSTWGNFPRLQPDIFSVSKFSRFVSALGKF